MKGRVIAVSGIDTGIGKTVATGHIARVLSSTGARVITQKVAQTGCEGISGDIAVHREIMGIGLQEVDLDGTTCPYVFGYPASPHLAASMEGKEIDLLAIRRATFILQKRYDLVLLEGAGGLLVPLNENRLFADYLRDAGYGLVLVTSPRLGSINHTLLSIEACRSRGIELRALVYNRYGQEAGPVAVDTRRVIERSLRHYGLSGVPVLDLGADGFSPDDASWIAGF
ncbi:MAG: ATP-dependent dethiobiotin synthetase BioD [Chlorobiaceae bacterium]|nr:ATP-dependent dethiobiotin synthetase BioD [Chlorobiaceae bacterium]